MTGIIVVGLGPGAPGALTREAWQVLQEAEEVWLRTMHHPVVTDLPEGVTLHAFDEVYEAARTFGAVYAEIARQVLALGRRDGGVVYAVPGHPLVGESTITQILDAAEEMDLPVRVVSGLSFVEPSLTALGVDALDGLQILDALDLLALRHPPINPDFPALIGQVYSRAVASDLKLVLMNQYADEHPIALIDGAGTDREMVRHLPLYEMDRYEVTPLSSLYVAPQPAVTSFEGFQETIARLRSPDGCPWDREQTHQSLRTNLLEECYEVLEAIDLEDPDALREELGDLLLQIVLHAQIAVEAGDFYMTGVIAQIDAKLKRRHPHVWGGVEVEGVGEVVSNWEAIKRRERAAKGSAERSLLDGIPAALPSLAQAAAYVDRAARVGFDRVDPQGIWVDLPGEVSEALTALVGALSGAEVAASAAPEGPPAGDGSSRMERRLGDLLLVLSDWARLHEIDPESALREANLRFAERFRLLERRAHDLDGDVAAYLASMSSAAIRRLWQDNEVG
jgi:tetrapyrrole methylase family protein/MazG family protein